MLPLSSVSHVLILDMCIFRGPVVLRRTLDQFVFIEKNSVLLIMISWQGFRGSSRVRQQFRESDRSLVERRPRVIKDKNSEEHDLAFLGSSPIVQYGVESPRQKKVFEYPCKALLDHAHGDTEPPAIRTSSRKAMPHVVTRFPRSTRIL